MTNEKKAFSNDQFKKFAIEHPEMELDTYEFPDTEGTFEGTIIVKRWGQSKNILAYVKCDDGRKIMCSAFQNRDYLGFPEMSVGHRVRLTFKKSRTGRYNLTNAERL